jgi:hypothetical protein
MEGDVVTSTFYLDHDEKFENEKPYELRFVPPKGFPARNCTWSSYDKIKVTDVRGRESDFRLNRHGFQLCRLETALNTDDFANNELVEQTYLKEAAQCLKEILQADRVLVFDYSVCTVITSGTRSNFGFRYARAFRAIPFQMGKRTSTRRRLPLSISVR